MASISDQVLSSCSTLYPNQELHSHYNVCAVLCVRSTWPPCVLHELQERQEVCFHHRHDRLELVCPAWLNLLSTLLYRLLIAKSCLIWDSCVYLSDPSELPIKVCEGQTTLAQPSIVETMSSIRNLQPGRTAILRLCRMVSRLIHSLPWSLEYSM